MMSILCAFLILNVEFEQIFALQYLKLQTSDFEATSQMMQRGDTSAWESRLIPLHPGIKVDPNLSF